MAEAVTRTDGENRPGPLLRGRGATLTLNGEPRDVQTARAYAREMVGSIPPGACEDVLVVVNELVSNAVQHGIGPISVAVTLEPSEVVIAVTDHGPETPSFRQPSPHDERGRGLRIVQRLTATWDVAQGDGSKTITAVVRLSSRRRDAAAARRKSSQQ
jgi:anti-sigma regulatory factor (Ser/Thr protein kinase)